MADIQKLRQAAETLDLYGNEKIDEHIEIESPTNITKLLDEFDARKALLREAEEALNDTLNMLRAAHMHSGIHHDGNKRVQKARATLKKIKAEIG